MTAPDALLFDFGGTLDADGVAWKNRFRQIFESWRIPSDAFDRAFHAADDALVGRIPADLSFRDTVQRLAQNLAAELGLPTEAAERGAEVFLDESLSKILASRELLKRLASRYRLGVVSNFYGNLEAVCVDTGIRPHLGVAIDSVAVGFEKPDPRIFQAALDALETSADRAVFIGDSLPRDMEGARRLGMPHIWLAPGAQAACCPADPVIANVAQLLEMFP